MAVKISKPLKRLLEASMLGRSRNHPLAGWHILTILYHDGRASGQPMTRNALLNQYNHNYRERHETPLTDSVIKGIMEALSEDAHLVEAATRKVRLEMSNGGFHMQQSYVYKITSSGIEYLAAMQRVVDAESTVTANITRIDEFCTLVHTLNAPVTDVSNTQLFNDFQNMVAAYSDVMKGMHKLDEDLDELADNLAFNHGGVAAEHLKTMLNDKAIPAFKKLIDQGPLIRALESSPTFFQRVAHSQQGSDDLNAANAIGDEAAMVLRLEKTQRYVQAQLQRLTLSFNASSEAIDSSLDSLYLLFDTIITTNQRLSEAYEAVQRQTVDVQLLTRQIDKLLSRYQSVVVNQPVPRHLAQDRELEDQDDFLEAATMGPVKYAVGQRQRLVYTAEDNPEVATDAELPAVDLKASLAEFKTLVMQTPTHGVVDRDLVFEQMLTRDELVRLYSATGYDYYEGFAPFGRTVTKVVPLEASQPVGLQLKGERYTAWIPHGFEFWLEGNESNA